MKEDFGRIMSGATITGVSDNMEANANIEKGEFIKFPDGSVAKALGERHTNGGIDVMLPDMTQILSNTKDLKIKSKDVKKIQKKYEMKNVSDNDTYSSVLTKYSRKIGYEKLLKEEEDLFNAVKKNAERALSEGSLRINNDYLAKKIYNVQERKAPLEKQISDMFNDLFVSQEKQKGVENVEVNNAIPVNVLQNAEQEMDRTGQNVSMDNSAEMQGEISEGNDLEGLSEQQVFALGGMVDDFKSLAKSNGYSYIDAYNILADRKVLPRFNLGGVAGDKPKASGTFKSNAPRVSKDAFFKFQDDYDNLKRYSYGDIPAMAKRLKGLLLSSGIATQDEIDKMDFSSLKSMDAIAGNMQSSLYGEYTEIIKHYSKTMPPTNRGLKMLVDNNILTEKQLNDMGMSSTNPKGMILGKNKSDLKPEDIKSINDKIEQALQSVTPELRDEYYRVNFVDNKWDYRAPEIIKVQFKDQADLDNSLKEEDGYVKLSDGTYTSKKTGLYILPEFEDVPPPPTEKLKVNEGEKNTTEGTEEGKYSNIDTEVNKRQNRYFQMPDQSFMPPLSLQPESLYLTRLGRLDPVAIGIEDTIRRNQEQSQLIGSQIQNLPPTVSAGIMGNAIAQQQMSENQVIDNTHAINAMNVSQAEQFNLKQADLEQSANNAERLDYERRALSGLSKTDQDLRNYYNAMRDVNINKFKEQQYMNTLANLFPKYTIDGTATGIEFSPYTKEYIDVLGGNRLAQALQYSQTPQTPQMKAKGKKSEKDNNED